MLRSNHYEVAFEAYLRARGVGFVAVDEAKRSELGGTAVKSVDFIVVGPEAAKLVVDVKGRKFPTGTSAKAVPNWQNWAEEEDVDGLGRWAAQFGGGFRGVLAFVYDIHKPYQLSDGTRDVFAFRDHTYLMRGIAVADYRKHMRLRSTKWKTVHLPAAAFRTLVRPFSDFLAVPPSAPDARATDDREVPPPVRPTPLEVIPVAAQVSPAAPIAGDSCSPP